MKKLMIAAIALSGFSAPAFAGHIDFTTQYDTRGECQSALVRSRNDVRSDPVQNQGYPPSEINRQYRTQVACQQQTTGKYMIVIIG